MKANFSESLTCQYRVWGFAGDAHWHRSGLGARSISAPSLATAWCLLRATASRAEHAVRELRGAWHGYNQPVVLTPPCLDSWELLGGNPAASFVEVHKAKHEMAFLSFPWHCIAVCWSCWGEAMHVYLLPRHQMLLLPPTGRPLLNRSAAGGCRHNKRE